MSKKKKHKKNRKKKSGKLGLYIMILSIISVVALLFFLFANNYHWIYFVVVMIFGSMMLIHEDEGKPVVYGGDTKGDWCE